MTYNITTKELIQIVIIVGDKYHLFPVLIKNLGYHKLIDKCKAERIVP
jgi:hypothetical protein